MNLFKRKKCSQNLIYLDKGNLVFKGQVKQIYRILELCMIESGKFDERLYFDMYNEYLKHYVIYDTTPQLLQYKIPLIFGKRFPGITFSKRFTFEYLIPGRITYSKIPSCFELPKYIEEHLIRIFNRVGAYIEIPYDENMFTNLIRLNFLKEWGLFDNSSMLDAYISSQLDLIHSYAKVENQTIVKNIIERTLEEIIEETIGKNNEEHGK